MDVPRLRYFLSAARHQSFSRAAAEHHVTQSAMSQQMRALERELRVSLFARRGRRLELTPAGRLLQGEAAEVLARLERASGELARFQDVPTGTLRIGTMDIASIYYLPETFRRFRDRFPGIEVFVEVNATRPLAEGVLTGRLDLAVASLPYDHPQLQSVPLFRDVLIPVARAGHPLAGKRSVRPEDLAREPLICYHRDSITRGLIDRIYEGWGVTPTVAMEIDSPAAIARLVGAGLGVSIVPERSVEHDLQGGNLAPLRTRPARFVREIGLLTRKERRPAPPARLFVEQLESDHHLALPVEGDSRPGSRPKRKRGRPRR
jgi:DNA-binding transcriptional LysR family regulator